MDTLASKSYKDKRRGCLFAFVFFQVSLTVLFFMHFQSVSESVTIRYPPRLASYLLRNDSLSAVFQKGFAQLKKVIVGDEAETNAWYARTDKMEVLMENPVLGEFNISKVANKEHINLLLMVSTAPKRSERREAIRDTWWQYCKSTNRVTVKCVFMTDAMDTSTEQGAALANEQKKFGDLEFQHLQSGLVFGKRYMYHLVWAMQKYNFDYFVRMDDDMFLCVDRLLHELPLPPLPNYHWGWVHCLDNIVRPEESIIMLSHDVVARFLGQHPKRIMCHPWADQMVGTWSEELAMPKFYHHDPRVHHDPPAQFAPEFATKQNVCHQYIAVHGSYPPTMRTLWKNRGSFDFPSKTLMDYAHVCSVPQKYNWRLFTQMWRSEPKPCISHPTWDLSKHLTTGQSYSGREGT